MAFKPLLGSAINYKRQRFPCYGSIKYDGIRATIQHGAMGEARAYSRSMKPIPNRHLQRLISQHQGLWGLDGEFLVTEPNDPNACRQATSVVMSQSAPIPDLVFWVFDAWCLGEHNFNIRHAMVRKTVSTIGLPWVKVVEQVPLHNMKELENYRDDAFAEGYEGIMLRDPTLPYKQGRGSAISQELVKVKQWEDMEAEVIGLIEKQHNGNEAFYNELGRTARSTHQANKIGLGTTGALWLRGLDGPFKGVEFSAGGFSDIEAARLWKSQRLNWIAKIKYMPHGSKDKPRHPNFICERHSDDM